MNTAIALPLGIIQRAVRSPARWERTLAKREIFRLEASEPLSLSDLDGVLWITIEGDTTDYVLRPGEGLRINRGQVAIVQALRPGRFGVSPTY